MLVIVDSIWATRSVSSLKAAIARANSDSDCNNLQRKNKSDKEIMNKRKQIYLILLGSILLKILAYKSMARTHMHMEQQALELIFVS